MSKKPPPQSAKTFFSMSPSLTCFHNCKFNLCNFIICGNADNVISTILVQVQVIYQIKITFSLVIKTYLYTSAEIIINHNVTKTQVLLNFFKTSSFETHN